MKENNPSEKWKPVVFDFEFTNTYRLEISNYGRLRTFHKVSNGNIIKGSMINGYRIIRLKFYKPRDGKTQQQFDYLEQQVLMLSRGLKKMQLDNAGNKETEDTLALLQSLKQNLSKKYRDDLNKRTINYHALIHRLVAVYFLNEPNKDQTVVAHLDHDKLNNTAGNLKWMTPEENQRHQQYSPDVIKERQSRHLRKDKSKNAKLTITKVMLLKKMLNNGKPLKQLVKQFKITDTQILRIKRGENWQDVEAAK